MAQVAPRGASTAATVLFMIAAVGCAAAAAWVLAGVLERKYSRDPVQPVVVVALPLHAGQPLRAKYLRVAEWPQSAIPVGAFSRIQDALEHGKGGKGEEQAGRVSVPLIPLVPGEPLLRSHLSVPRSGIGIAARLEIGKRAVAVSCADPVTLSRLVYPGARVDVLSTVNDYDAEGHQLLKTRVVLQDVTILAVGEDIDPLTIEQRRSRSSSKGEAGSGGELDQNEAAAERQARGVVTLLVTPEQAATLTLADRDGHLDFALRHPDDRQEITPRMVSRSLLAVDDAEGAGNSPQADGVAMGAGLSAGAAQRAAVTRGASARPAGRRERYDATLRESPGLRILRSSGAE